MIWPEAPIGFVSYTLAPEIMAVLSHERMLQNFL